MLHIESEKKNNYDLFFLKIQYYTVMSYVYEIELDTCFSISCVINRLTNTLCSLLQTLTDSQDIIEEVHGYTFE